MKNRYINNKHSLILNEEAVNYKQRNKFQKHRTTKGVYQISPLNIYVEEKLKNVKIKMKKKRNNCDNDKIPISRYGTRFDAVWLVENQNYTIRDTKYQNHQVLKMGNRESEKHETIPLFRNSYHYSKNKNLRYQEHVTLR